MLIELSHPIHDGMITYPGIPGPEISAHLTREASRGMYAPGVEFHIGKITLVANTGTYLDTPFHRYPSGADLSGLPLDRMADLPGLVLRTKGTLEGPLDVDVRGRAVLIHTGWADRWGTDAYFASDNPYVTEAGARWLAGQGAALVGIDSLNIDSTNGKERPAHSILLDAGIPIVEHMTNLEALPDKGFRFHAAPPRVVEMGTFPVRAYAVVPE